MMSRLSRYLLSVLILIFGAQVTAWAQEAAPAGLIQRPMMEYQSAKLRDPFKTYLTKDEPPPPPPEDTMVVPVEFDREKLKVQGVIWGGRAPQAIINDQVVTVGSLIEGAEILSIDKTGITFGFGGVSFSLDAPGAASVKIKPEANSTAAVNKT